MRSPDLHFVPYDTLGGRPNVIVDGSPTDGTVLCLSHWPGMVSPDAFLADLSAEMAFAYLDHYGLHGSAVAVSNNHFDQDGLVSLFALIDPDAAIARRALLIDVAGAGDFARFRHREAARISMVLSAYATAERSPMADLPGDYGEMTAQLYTELIERIGELCDHPDRYRSLWAEEDATLSATEAALATGAISIEEVDDIDLAVVTVTEGAPNKGGHRFAGQWVSGPHPMALYNATDRFAVLLIRGQHVEFSYRYETWVQYRSRPLAFRVDLEALAERLNGEEPGSSRWVASRVSSLIPTLRIEGEGVTDLDPGRVRLLLENHLRSAPPAWNPYPSSQAPAA
jgi:hypothetical protein